MLNMGGFFDRLQQLAQNALPPFNVMYRAFPVACTNKASAAQSSIEQGDKIILPPSALDQLAQLKVTYPMMFELTNQRTGMKSHCGVLEFSAEEGVAYLPYWMMDNLGLESSSLINVRNVTLSKGTFVQLQPHKTKFTELANPRVVLEKALRSFSCLTKGDTIAIRHADTVYHLDIVEVKPGTAISIYETDVNVDFKEPKDYKEYTKKLSDTKQQSGAAVASAAAASTAVAASGAGAGARTASVGKTATGADDAGGGWGADSGDVISHSGSSSTPSSSSTASGSSDSGSGSGSSNYFAQFKTGYRLKGAKPTAVTTSGGAATTTATAAGAAPSVVTSSPIAPPNMNRVSSEPSPNSGGASDRKLPPERKLPAAAYATSSASPSAGGASTSPAGEKTVKRVGNFEYVYQKGPGGKDKLLKRKSVNPAAKTGGFTAFSGEGNKLK